MINEIDNIEKHEKVMLICTTNDIEKINVNVRRSGRLDKLIKVNVPGLKERLDILRFYLNGNQNGFINDSDIEEISLGMNGFTGSDIKLLVREA